MSRGAILAVGLAVLLTACGKVGTLRLPDEPATTPGDVNEAAGEAADEVTE